MWAFLLGTVPLAAESFCPLGGWTQLQAPATGFFTVREIEGVWWWIDPHGHAFLSKGVNHITFQGDPSPALGYSPYPPGN
ncbi:MAG: hypothetical protein KatS3mg115_2459 [Candidatus Poribacteria bacterium]|nr:MAG: hypothetical protein KatS3mg115_2459 [Candidatus Poribacteria bacterium]